jgi:hypothetical protein
MIRLCKSLLFALTVLCGISAQATEQFHFSYTFTYTGAPSPWNNLDYSVSGNFTGDRNGDVITNLTFLDTTFTYTQDYKSVNIPGVQSFEYGFAKSISFSGKQNNFWIYANGKMGTYAIYSSTVNPDNPFTTAMGVETQFDWPWYYTYVEDRKLNSTWSVTAVPEPETFSMLLAGIAVMGIALRRRKQSMSIPF